MHWLELLVELTLMPLVAFVIGLLMVLMMRRIAARLQRRIGPPLLQPLYDIVKLFSKRTQTSHGLLHEFGIVMAIGWLCRGGDPAAGTGHERHRRKGGMITLLYLTMIPSLGSRWASDSVRESQWIDRHLARADRHVGLRHPVRGRDRRRGDAFGTTNLDVVAQQQAGGIEAWG